MSNVINIAEILTMIPHRYPLLLVDRILEYKLGESIVGIKNITFNEPQFTGHFPGIPVMPGVLIIEAMAQVAAVPVAKTIDAKPNETLVYFMGVENAKFRKVVEPGDMLHIYVKIEQHRATAWKFSSIAKVGENIVAESHFSAMVKSK